MNRLQSAMRGAPVKTPESRQYDPRARRGLDNSIQCKALRSCGGVRFCAGPPSGKAPPPSAACSRPPKAAELQPGPTQRPPSPIGLRAPPATARPGSRDAPSGDRPAPAPAVAVTIFRAEGLYAIGHARLPAAASPRSRANSSSDMKNRSSTGRTAKLAKNPSTSRPAIRYIVTLYAWAAGTPRSIWYSRM